MNFVDLLFQNRLDEAKEKLVAHLGAITAARLEEAKRYVASENYEEVEIDEARNPNLVKMGRITKVRRRIRRNAKGQSTLPPPVKSITKTAV